ncbi:MAG: A/G-specific adenine glycosylase [Opitutales bacterium]
MTDLREHLPAFREALARWYVEHHRRLPWRVTPSLYSTVVSEFMCQQTQVATVLPYFERWMERFADFETLADAPEAVVLKHWEGLGYYSRARNLQRLARAYVASDPKPTTVDGWRAFPGVGPYTAAAIASIHFQAPEAVVDGNVVRILARLTADATVFRGGGPAVAHFQALAREVLEVGEPGNHNQAMMELGATVCLKRRPLCTVCPVVGWCAGAASGEPEAMPRIERTKTERVEVTRLWVRRSSDGAILLERGEAGSRRLAHLHEFPELGTVFASGLPKDASVLLAKSRGISNQRIRETFYRYPADAFVEASTADNPRLAFHTPAELEALTLSGPHRKWLPALLEAHAAQTEEVTQNGSG